MPASKCFDKGPHGKQGGRKGAGGEGSQILLNFKAKGTGVIGHSVAINNMNLLPFENGQRY